MPGYRHWRSSTHSNAPAATATPSTPCSTAWDSAARCASGCIAWARPEAAAWSAVGARGVRPGLRLLPLLLLAVELLENLLPDDLHRCIVDVDLHDRHLGQFAAGAARCVGVLPVADGEEIQVLPVHRAVGGHLELFPGRSQG